jgi:hypothetical protein
VASVNLTLSLIAAAASSYYMPVPNALVGRDNLLQDIHVGKNVQAL